ncbi:hypothetical protein B9Z19DRAFT_1128591 [Tuber borchii]|uniref:Uncharacterized protein n=1 Tax=Tuber borchii TaxID=42251 RepID=A0A2T6ZNZ5_TUBBO|nr:hypothetical protein B9Z19DRAFT_1128591 [Tuber borchii]
MIQTHHCRKCSKVTSSRCFKKCGLQICHLHPNHAFGANSTCRACPDPRGLVIGQESEIAKESKKTDALPEERTGPKEQGRVRRLMEEQKAQRGRSEKSRQVSQKKRAENSGVRYAVKGKRPERRGT